MTNFYSLLRERSIDGTAFIKNPEGKTLATYQDMEDRSAGYASYLLSLGLQKGARVMVQVEKSLEALFLCLGRHIGFLGVREGAEYIHFLAPRRQPASLQARCAATPSIWSRKRSLRSSMPT